MELRALGKTGLRVSPIGLGTTKLGRTEQLKYPGSFELPSDAQITRLLETARGFGVNLIDTAPAYGTSEERLGGLLAKRDDWVIVTKAGEEFRDGRSHFDFSPAAIRSSVERSLGRLRTDWLDVVLVHTSDDDASVVRDSAALDTLCELREAGMIRAIGASTKSVEAGLLALERSNVVMLALNSDDQSQVPVIEAAREAGVGVLIKKPLRSGHDANPSQALADAVRVPGVASVIVGTIDAGHCADNCRTVERALAAT